MKLKNNMPKKNRLLFSFFYCCQRQNYIEIKMKKIRIRLDTIFRKVGEPKCLPRKAKGGGKESALLNGQGSLLLVFSDRIFIFH